LQPAQNLHRRLCLAVWYAVGLQTARSLRLRTGLSLSD
jgi:hypothetical protein